GAGDVHIEHIDAKNLVFGTKIDRLATWGAWNTVTFAEGIERLDNLRFNAKTHIILPSTLKYIGESITTYSGTTYELPNYDKVDIRCLQLKNWRSEQWTKAGRCPRCGGTYTGLFKKKCGTCGYEMPKR
ncbi:MAG: hypothetical protein J5804_00515, partial [Eggerthellaceae bacterium]|nr:hypothetical protein [Eggerthellaceae bacterium]